MSSICYNPRMKKIIPIMVTLLIIAMLAASCGRGGNKNKDFGEYVITGTDREVSTGAAVPGAISPDYSWMRSYALKYTYFDGTDVSEITEGKSANYYRAEDAASGSIVYIERKEGYMLEYMLNTSDRTGAATVVTDSSIADLHSGFMMLSAADTLFPSYANVTRLGEETVGGRPAVKYMQNGEPASGSAGRTAYVWLDSEYNFASKCELYDADTQKLTMSWELKSFVTDVPDDSVKIDLSEFTITG